MSREMAFLSTIFGASLVREEKMEERGVTALDQFHYANFVCPRTRTVINKRYGEGEIINHKSTCPFCLEAIEKEKAEKEAKWDGMGRMKYILHAIHQAKSDIEYAKKKIEELREQEKNPDTFEYFLRMHKWDISLVITIHLELGFTRHKIW